MEHTNRSTPKTLVRIPVRGLVTMTVTPLILGLALLSLEAASPGPFWRPSRVPVPFVVNPANAPAGFAEACRDAADTWTRDPRFAFTFRDEGDSTLAESKYDDTHVVFYEPDGGGMDPNTLAVTWSWNCGFRARCRSAFKAAPNRPESGPKLTSK